MVCSVQGSPSPWTSTRHPEPAAASAQPASSRRCSGGLRPGRLRRFPERLNVSRSFDPFSVSISDIRFLELPLALFVLVELHEHLAEHAANLRFHQRIHRLLVEFTTRLLQNDLNRRIAVAVGSTIRIEFVEHVLEQGDCGFDFPLAVLRAALAFHPSPSLHHPWQPQLLTRKRLLLPSQPSRAAPHAWHEPPARC